MGILKRARRFFSGPDKKSSRERRRLKRMACQQAFVCTKGEESFPLTVLDVGFGGFKVLTEHPVGERGDLLHLRRVSTDFRRHLTGAYTTGLMVRVAWTKRDGEYYESGLHLPEAPGSMRISWFKELLSELGLSEKEVFTQRNTRRHRCHLPARLTCGPVPEHQGTLLDLSPGGCLFGSNVAAPMGKVAELSVVWGVKELSLSVEVVGVRPNNVEEMGSKWLHSLKFQGELSRSQEKILYSWLEELADNE